MQASGFRVRIRVEREDTTKVRSDVADFVKRIKTFEASATLQVICGVLAGMAFTFALRSLTTGNATSIFTLLFFNLFFVFLSFPLDGALKRKLVLLLLGNCIYLLLNHLLDRLSTSLQQSYGAFDRLHVIFGPFVNMFWIVSFWSFGLTFLAGSRKKEVSSEVDC